MRKKSLTIILCLFGLSMAFAQEDCKMCGDWVGTFKGVEGQCMMYIRIKQYGNEIKIRTKLKTPNEIVYDFMAPTRILAVTDTSIEYSWGEYDDPRPSYLDETITDWSNTFDYYIITYKNGYIHLLNNRRFVDEYNRNKVFMYRREVEKPNMTPLLDLDLYKEDDNW